MKKGVFKVITFIAVFLISMIAVSYFMNLGNTDMTAQMGEATLPTIALMAGDTQVNLMRGYTEPMETATMRDGITPIDGQRQVEAMIHTYGQEIAEVSYEVRSVDGQRLIEKTVLSSFYKDGDDWRASFRLKDLIEEGEEYSLIFVLTLADQSQARYYARVVQADYSLEEKLAFVQGFSDATFDAEKLKEYTRYLEPNSEGDNSTLAKVNIHSSAKQVAWGGLAAERLNEPEIRILEIAPQTASVTLAYFVSYPSNDGTAVAQVEEYYRIRLTAERMYLLDYERTAQQLFEEDAASFVNNKIMLGIAQSDVQMMESDSGTVLAFSHAGELFSYNNTDGKLARLFSFYDHENDDGRTWYRQHDYRILQVDETGNVTFLVYGYMNRGRHEGRCGIQVSYYSSSLNMVEELAFIPYGKSPQILKADVENLSYVNGKNDLYLMLDGSIFHVGLEEKSCSVVVQGLAEDSYCVSEDRSMVIWQSNGQGTVCTQLTLMDLNSGEADRIDAQEGNYLRPLGFMGEDFIYGIAAGENIKEDSLGYRMFPMHQIIIRDFEGNVLKTYGQEGLYVTSCEIAGNQINLERVRMTEEGFESAQADQILYSETIRQGKNYVETAVTENLETIVQISLNRPADSKKIKFLTPKEVLFEESRKVDMAEAKHPDRYYIYGKTGVVDILSSPSEAVQLAYENAGTVTAEDGSYLWKRDRLHTSNQIMAIKGEAAEEGESSLAVCLNAILSFEGVMRDSTYLLQAGKDVTEILEENLEGRKILNLQGCSLDMALYYPDREIPVLAVLQDGSAVLITGFNEKNVVLMDPADGTVYKMGMNDAREWFAENGNRFITYW